MVRPYLLLVTMEPRVRLALGVFLGLPLPLLLERTLPTYPLTPSNTLPLLAP